MGSVVAILAGTAGAMGLYVFFVESLWVLPLLEWMTPNILYRVKTRKELVALSFDDGPHARFTPQVLEILEQHEARATFFLIGERVQRNPELVLRIRSAGHEIGNHYWENGPTLGHSRAEFVERLEATERAIGLAAHGKEGPLQTLRHSSGQEAGPTTGEIQDSGSEGEPGAPIYNGVGVVKRHGWSCEPGAGQGRFGGFCRTVYRRPLTPRTARKNFHGTKPTGLRLEQDLLLARDHGSLLESCGGR